MADPATTVPQLVGAAAAPPHDEEAEAAVLGAIMLADKWMDPIVGECDLSPDDFYRPRNRVIFAAMVELFQNGEAIDTLTVADALSQLGRLDDAGGKDYIETAVTRIPSLGNTKQYGHIVKENSMLRKLIRATQQIQESVKVRDGEPADLIEQAQNLVAEVAGQSVKGGLVGIDDALMVAIKNAEDARNSTDELTGVTTGLRDLDAITNGWQDGNLIVIGARPSMGKSALASTIADAAASKGYPVAVFTMEMDRSEVSQRMLAGRSHLPGGDIKRGELQPTAWPRLMKAADQLSKLPIEIDDGDDQTVNSIRAKVRRSMAKSAAKGERGIELVIIDYLQMLRVEDPRAPRAYQVEEQTRALKRMARSLGIPIIILAQLSREVERRSPPIPQLSDLKDSGAIEQDADVVLFIYREHYYQTDSERPGEADLILAKHRGGETGTVEVGFVAHYPAFCDLIFDRSSKNAESTPDFVAGRDDPGEEKELAF